MTALKAEKEDFIMWLGVDYYPEQWDKSMINSDLDNILEIGGNVIRIAEFAWHLMEKTEGQYDFSFFDMVIEKAKARGIKVIMGTPTAAIPAWLAKKHPDILSEFENGQKRVFGGRHVYCFNSPVLYEYSEKIIREMANHYKNEEAIIAWQIDNELGHEDSDMCYCKNCQEAFRKFLSDKFGGDIDKLNETYGTAFWSQEYNDFSEIPTPMATITTHNPALRMDWERFRNKSIVNYADFQVKLLKEICGDVTVIHDFPGGGLEKHMDYSDVAKNLDVVAYNNYPVWGGQKEPLAPFEIAFALDYIRGLKRQNFWITEAIMGAQGHDITGFLPRPNQAKMWSYQGLARGCESLLYFRYRGATNGAEQFCYGIIDADNLKKRKFYEVQSLFKDVKNYEKELTAPIKSDVAIIYDYDSLAAFRIQRQSQTLNNMGEMKKLFRPFYELNINVDIINAREDISDYKVVIVPQMIVYKEEFEKKLREFAENGGTVVMTYRTAVKDRDNNLVLNKILPVNFDDFAGVYVEETESLQSYDAFQICGNGEYLGEKGTGGVFRDMLVCKGAESLYNYGDKFYSEYSAVTKNSYGKGVVYYFGCTPDRETIKKIMENIIRDENIEYIVSPENIEIAVRGDDSGKIKMIINHNDFEVDVDGIKLEAFETKIIPIK